MNTKTCPKAVIITDLEFLVKAANVDYTAVFVTRTTYEVLKDFSKVFKSAAKILENIRLENVLEIQASQSMILTLSKAENELVQAYKSLCNTYQSEKLEVRVATGSSKLRNYCYRNNIPVIEVEEKEEEKEK